MPWLQAHNPHINWATGEIKFSSTYHQPHCIQKATGDPSPLFCLDSELHQSVPVVYHDFLDRFSKKGAEALSPHRSYDCPIELLPGAEVPFGRIFPLTELELDNTERIHWWQSEEMVYSPIHLSGRHRHFLCWKKRSLPSPMHRLLLFVPVSRILSTWSSPGHFTAFCQWHLLRLSRPVHHSIPRYPDFLFLNGRPPQACQKCVNPAQAARPLCKSRKLKVWTTEHSISGVEYLNWRH